jgi:hypothetical protein
MDDLRKYVALSSLSAALSFGWRDHIEPRMSDDPDDYDPVRRVVFAKPRKATFVSERPLTKRQRRRLRGRGQ